MDGKLRNEAFHQTLDDKKRHYIQDGYNNYYFINGNDVQIQIAHQVSRHEKNRTETQGTFASAYINHGVSPQNAQYEYMVLVQPTPKELKAVRRKAPYRILHKDDTAHVSPTIKPVLPPMQLLRLTLLQKMRYSSPSRQKQW